MLTVSPQMEGLFEILRRVARTEASVLLRGETGTGKELAAQAIHSMSKREGKPFKAVNCATLTPELAASTLFGHVRGAFTGAVSDRRGLFTLGDTGTVFLDEVAELGLDIQARLLRVLQERNFVPVGGTEPVFKRIEPLLYCMGEAITHCGPVGAGEAVTLPGLGQPQRAAGHQHHAGPRGHQLERVAGLGLGRGLVGIGGRGTRGAGGRVVGVLERGRVTLAAQQGEREGGGPTGERARRHCGWLYAQWRRAKTHRPADREVRGSMGLGSGGGISRRRRSHRHPSHRSRRSHRRSLLRCHRCRPCRCRPGRRACCRCCTRRCSTCRYRATRGRCRR